MAAPQQISWGIGSPAGLPNFLTLGLFAITTTEAASSRFLNAAAWPLVTSTADAWGVGQADAWPLTTLASTALRFLSSAA